MVAVRGGEKLAAALKEIAAKINRPATLKVGFLEKATYPDGQHVAEVAYYNEYGRTVTVTREHPTKGELGGTYYQLPRPFFRNMIAAKAGSWPAAIGANLSKTNYDVTKTLNLAGEGIKGQLQQSIRDTNSPPLAPATIARKGFSKPLVDTGHMLNSVDFEVNE